MYVAPLILQFLVLSAHQVTSNVSLEQGNDFGQTFVTHILKHTQHTSFEEDFGCAKTVLVGVHLEGRQDLVCHLLTINESLGDGVGGKNGVSAIKELNITV